MRLVSLVAGATTSADGVRDHAALLGGGLERRGHSHRLEVVDWRADGRRSIVEALDRCCGPAHADAVILHYSHLAWSRRGLPFGLLDVVRRVRRRGPVLLWIHDPCEPGTTGWRAWLLARLKGAGLRVAVVACGGAVVSVHRSRVFWLRKWAPKRVVFLPSPTNVGVAEWAPPADRFTISCFGIRIGERESAVKLLEQIAEQFASVPTRLRVLGSMDEAAAEKLRARLASSTIHVDVPGALPEAEVRKRLGASHVFLAIGGLTTRSGTLGAALASGLPVVGVAGVETGPPLDEAGIVLVPSLAASHVTPALLRLRDDERLLATLAEASRRVASTAYDWDGITTVAENLLSRLVLRAGEPDAVGTAD